MPNILDTVQISGSSYDLKDKNAPSVSAVTQQEYDNLPSSAKTSNTFFVISDAQAGDLSQYWTSAQTQSAINQSVSGKASQTDLDTVSGQVENKQDTLVSGTNIKTINNTSILGSGNIDIQGGGGGKAIEAGRGISITTGETADTVSFNLPISAGTKATNLIIGDATNISNANRSIATGYQTKAQQSNAFAQGYKTDAGQEQSHAEGYETKAYGVNSHSEGKGTSAMTVGSHAEGLETITSNSYEHTQGQYNVSSFGSSTFGDSGNTLFSVGNGTSNNARHNAFEIRQNGDIYITSGGTDIKLQDNLGGGGGSSYTAGDGIDITNDVISVTGKADTSAVTAIQDSLSGYVTTDTEQIISGRKIFTYSASSSKAIEFKQTDGSSKVGFRVRTSAATNNEVASFEFRPNTFTVDGVQHPLLYFGHYRSTAIANAGVPQTYIGFRQYDQLNAAAYHYLIPLPEKAKTPFSLTTSFKDYYAPMGFKNGSTMITADDTGVVDLSSELGGLKLVKLSQAEYDALVTKDNSTLYVIIN